MTHCINSALKVFLFFTLFSSSFVVMPQQSETAAALHEAMSLGSQWNRESIKRAIEIYLAQSENYQKLNDRQSAAQCLLEAGRLHNILGEKEVSERLFSRALRLLNGARFPAEESVIYSELAILALETGQVDKSREHIEKAEMLARQSKSPKALAAALFSAGEFFYVKNEVRQSLESYRKSIELWRQAKDLRNEAKSTLGLGYLYLKQSDFQSGMETLNSALIKYQNAQDTRGSAVTSKAIGYVLNVMNEKQKALEILLKAEQLFPENLDYAERASLYNSIGHIYEDYEEWQLSLNYRKKAFEFFKKENHLYGQLATLPSLGKLSGLSGDKVSAIKYFKEVEEIAERLNDEFYIAISKNHLGDLYFRHGETDKALFNYQSSIKLFKENVHQKFIAQTLNKMGRIYKQQGSPDLSRKTLLNSLELSRKVKDTFSEADTLYHLAKLDEAEGKIDGALNQIEASIKITESLYTDVLNSKLKSTYFSNVYDRYELYIGLLMKMHKNFPDQGFDARALQASEKSRSRSMLETLRLTEADFTKDANPETVRREKEIRSLLNAKADKMTDLLSQKADQSEIQKISDDINELTNELELIKAELKQNSPVYSAIQNPPPFDISEFQKQILDDKTVLLEFSFGNSESHLWLIEKDGFSGYTLPAREQIETRIIKLRELLGSRERRENEAIEDYQARVAEADELYWREARTLSSELLGQIADRLGTKRLLIVSDGKLHYFPVSALPFPNSETDQPILLTNEIINQPSASTLLLLTKSEKQYVEPSKNLLVFSDPVFSEDDARLVPSNQAGEKPVSLSTFRFAESLNWLPRLTASKTEADSIAEIVGSRRSDVYSGFAANREKFLNINVSEYKIIHLATHGLIDEQRPELSGIVLSRFGEYGQKLNEFVRLQDIYGMKLSADLVVLSACNTGIGKEVRGEGLQSLNNGFLQTGAKSVMSSLWKVDDYATLELMKNFYESLADGKHTPAGALRDAQIKLWKSAQYKSPFYWAAFTIQGDFRRTPNLSSNWGYTPYFLILLLPVLLYGIWKWRNRRILDRRIKP